MDEVIYTNGDTKYDISCIIVLTISIFGLISNAVTLFAFQHAKRNRMCNFQKSFNVITIFIWNLSLVDFLSSLNMTIIYLQFVFSPAFINHKFVCTGLITMRDILVLINASAIACISIVKVIGITKNMVWEDFCDSSTNVKGVIILTWVVGFVFYSGKLVKVVELLASEGFGDSFDCGSFFFQLNLSPVTLYSEFLAHTLAILIMFVSYAKIAIHVRKTSTTENRLNTTEKTMQTTKLVLLVGAVYILQCVPYMIARFWFEDRMRVGFSIQFPLTLRVCYILYYTQFSVNILIYIIRNNDYRGAYVYSAKSIASKCCFLNTHTDAVANTPPNDDHELDIIQV